MKDFMKYLAESPVSFYAVKNLKNMLNENGFEQLPLYENWQIEEGGKYYVYTKGDANPKEDNYVVEQETIMGTVKAVVPYVGLPTVWLNEI